MLLPYHSIVQARDSQSWIRGGGGQGRRTQTDCGCMSNFLYPPCHADPSQNVNIGSCPLPEGARCVKGGLRGFCRLCVPACSSHAHTLHALRASGVSSWYVGLHGSFGCRLSQRSSTCCSATTLSARSVRSFFSACDRASTRPFVDARGPLDASALGRDPPDTDKICSIVLRDSLSLHNQGNAWPIRPGQGESSSWHGAAGIQPPRRRINTVTKVDLFSPMLLSSTVYLMNLGGGQGNGGNRPERRARARRGMRVD